MHSLRSRILKNVKEKLQSVTLTAEVMFCVFTPIILKWHTLQALANNLNSLVLLENQSTSDLLNTFVKHRQMALSTVIGSAHSSVRVQISSMVHCLIATVHLLHDCFIRKLHAFCGKVRIEETSVFQGTEDSDRGLIWQQLEKVVGDRAPETISKMELPATPLTAYIPPIVRKFR